jgi:hypothetical protein
MSMEETKQALVAAEQDLDVVRDRLVGMQNSYTLCDEVLAEVLTYAQLLVPALMQKASESYEEGVKALVEVSAIYNEQVLPGLERLNIRDVDEQKARLLIESIESISDQLKAAKDRVLADFLPDDNIFSVPNAVIKEFADSTEQARLNVQNGLVDQDAPLSQMIGAIIAWRDATRTYNK